MIRITLILISLVPMLMTGCKVASKQTTACSCAACATGCGSMSQVQTASNPTQEVKEVAQALEPTAPKKQLPVVNITHTKAIPETVKEIPNPFEALAEAPTPEIPSAPIPALPEYAHGEKYEWLLGQLQRVHSTKHQWKVRYASLDEHDQWGGSMVLAPDARLDQWKDGDAVYIEGEILTKRPSVYLSGPLYRVQNILSKAEAQEMLNRDQQR